MKNSGKSNVSKSLQENIKRYTTCCFNFVSSLYSFCFIGRVPCHII